jgi:hypothetical protein
MQWQLQPQEFVVVAVNLALHRGQCYAPLCVPGLAGFNWSMRDLLGPETYVRAGSDLAEQGLYLDLPGHGAQLFHFTPVGSRVNEFSVGLPICHPCANTGCARLAGAMRILK